MSDINGNIVQSAAPGALLRSAAEATSQDPTKTQQPAAQPNSPIRSLTQNPIESTLPSTTPRVLNSVPVQQPNPDFTGLHAMLSSAPVPPPHVAAQLIRAMMTPPSGGSNGGVLAPSQPVTPEAASPAMGGGQTSQPGQPGQIMAPSQPMTSRSAQAPASNGGSRGNGGFSPVNASINRPSIGQSFSSAPSGQLNQPTTRQNVLGNSGFLGGTVKNAVRGAEDVAAESAGKLSRFLSPAADIFGGMSLSDFITNRLGLGGWFNPKPAS